MAVAGRQEPLLLTLGRYLPILLGMRRRPGTLLPIEVDILDAGLQLRRGDRSRFHGFQLAKQIADHAGPRPLTAHGTLYKALQRLEEAGLLDQPMGGPNHRRRRGTAPATTV